MNKLPPNHTYSPRGPALKERRNPFGNPLLNGTEVEKKSQFWSLLLYYHKKARECGRKLDVDIFLHELRALATNAEITAYHAHKHNTL